MPDLKAFDFIIAIGWLGDTKRDLMTWLKRLQSQSTTLADPQIRAVDLHIYNIHEAYNRLLKETYRQN